MCLLSDGFLIKCAARFVMILKLGLRTGSSQAESGLLKKYRLAPQLPFAKPCLSFFRREEKTDGICFFLSSPVSLSHYFSKLFTSSEPEGHTRILALLLFLQCISFTSSARFPIASIVFNSCSLVFVEVYRSLSY